MGEGVTKRSQITGGGAPRDHIGYILEIFLGRGSHQKIKNGKKNITTKVVVEAHGHILLLRVVTVLGMMTVLRMVIF